MIRDQSPSEKLNMQDFQILFNIQYIPKNLSHLEVRKHISVLIFFFGLKMLLAYQKVMI